MPKTLTSAADRLLSAFVPSAKAGACCPPDPYTQTKCIDGYKYRRTCSYNCACKVYCGVYSYTGSTC